MRHPRTMLLAATLCGAATAVVHAAPIDVIVRGYVSANDIRVGQYAGVAVGAPIEFTVRLDTDDIFSDEPVNFTTYYSVDFRLATFRVDGVPVARGRRENVVSDSVLIFAGGDVYYQTEVPTIYFDLPDVTLMHCQFDGERSNPFNNTGHIEENLGTYPAAVFDGLQYFRVSVAHPGPPLMFRDMLLTADTFTFVPGSCSADFNGDGAANSGDFFDFLTAFFSGTPTADFNADGTINSQDVFDFLVAFFAGC